MTVPFTTDRVRFTSQGDVLVGDLYRPINTAAGQTALVVVTGSWTTCKEQQAARYARELAGQGMSTLTFDFRGFGQSQGEPRCWEDPARKIEDIHAAVGFAGTLDGVDPGRIGALGVCASSGYQAVNCASDDRVRALGLIAPWLHNAELVAPYYGGEQGVAERIAASRAAFEAYQGNGEVTFVPAVSETDTSAAMYGPYDYYLDPDRGAIPEWDARLAVMSWQPWLEFNPIDSGAAIAVPTQIVHSREGAVPDGAERFYELLTGPKNIVWTEGTQLDFYDQPKQVDLATALIADHFRAHL